MWTKKVKNAFALKVETDIMLIADCDAVLRYHAYTNSTIMTPRHTPASTIPPAEFSLIAIIDMYRGIDHLHGLGFSHNAITTGHVLVTRDGRGVLCGLSNVTPATPVTRSNDMYNAGVTACRLLASDARADHNYADLPMGDVRKLIAGANWGPFDPREHQFVRVIHGCLRADPHERLKSHDAVVILGGRPLTV